MSARLVKNISINLLALPPKPRGKLLSVWVCEWCGKSWSSFSDDIFTLNTTCYCQASPDNYFMVEMKEFKNEP